MLRKLPLKSVYRSDQDNILEDFYLPALSCSIAYDRAVGYFSATMLSFAAQGISAFIKNQGRMRLIFGGEIDEEDARAMELGFERKEIWSKLDRKLLDVIDNLADALTFRRLEGLSWLIATGTLDVKFALKEKGMYHEKIGILTDSTGDKVVFQGSANETSSALLPDFNFESISVYGTWRSELAGYYQPYLLGFEQLWENRTARTYVIPFPDAAKERLIQIARKGKILHVDVEKELWREKVAKLFFSPSPKPKAPSVPLTFRGEDFKLKEHQLAALNAWKSNDCQGIFEMATGSGKTITAIYGVVKVFEATKRLFVVISVPYQSLADQWVEELMNFDIHAIPCYLSRENWKTDLSESLYLFNSQKLQFVCVVVVNKTFASDEFQAYIKQVSNNWFVFIGDECHHHIAAEISHSLPVNARFRLGLSATPEHPFNIEGNKALIAYYGKVIYRYPLERALADNVLSPYYYHLQVVELTSEEIEKYEEISNQIARQVGSELDSIEYSDSELLKLLFFRRARLLSQAKMKIPALKKLISNKSPVPLSLFYCAEGFLNDNYAEDIRQLDVVSSLLHNEGWSIGRFTAEETPQDKRILLDRFEVGIIHGLVAMKCLDEGIDIPGCRSAYILASSRNPRQFVQRRGRILRRAPGKDFARIYDFLVRIPSELCAQPGLERKLFISELSRVREFAQLSQNFYETFETLKPFLEEYDLLHHIV